MLVAADADVDGGSIVVDDEPGAPRRTAVRIMHDMCAWLLELGLSTIADRAFAVAEESERLAVKKAKVRQLRPCSEARGIIAVCYVGPCLSREKTVPLVYPT